MHACVYVLDPFEEVYNYDYSSYEDYSLALPTSPKNDGLIVPTTLSPSDGENFRLLIYTRVRI